jgi:hypothetical protein
MRNSQHADERLDAEQADDTEEGDPAQHQDEHWLGPEMFVSDPDEDAADPEYADQCELMLEQLQEDVHLLLHQLQQESTRTPSRLIRCVDFVGVTSSLTAFAEADGRGNPGNAGRSSPCQGWGRQRRQSARRSQPILRLMHQHVA